MNGLQVFPEYVLKLHDVIEYRPGDIEEPPAELDYKVVYEDETLLIIDKPGNLCIHPSGPYFKHTPFGWAEKSCPFSLRYSLFSPSSGRTWKRASNR